MAKTKNHSIRFEQSDYDFICKREGLKTAQSIVTFLLKEYLKIYKIEKPSIFAAPKDFYDSPELPDNFKDEPVMFAEQLNSQFDSYSSEINSSDEIWQLEETIKEILIDKKLSSKEKSDLETLAKKKASKLI